MHLLYVYLSLVLCISGVDGDKHHHIKGKISYQIRSFSKDVNITKSTNNTLNTDL